MFGRLYCYKLTIVVSLKSTYICLIYFITKVLFYCIINKIDINLNYLLFILWFMMVQILRLK